MPKPNIWCLKQTFEYRHLIHFFSPRLNASYLDLLAFKAGPLPALTKPTFHIQ